MLRKINEAEVTSSAGFSIRYGKDSLTYSESARYVSVPIEHLGGPYEMVVYFSDAKNWYAKGKPSAVLDEEDRIRLADRVSESLQFLGRRFSIKM